MKKILICSPVRGGINQFYVRTLLMLHFCSLNKIMGGPNAPYDFRWATTSGTSVNLARDELTDLALNPKEDFHGIIWWDVDLGTADPKIMLDMFFRLLSHIDRVECVAGQYVGHRFISSFHGAVAHKDAEPDAHGLLEMGQIPIGFSYISTKALRQIKAFHPQREYVIKETEVQEAKGKMYEMFPIGVVGPCSDSGKMERLRKVVARQPTVASIEQMQEIAGIVWDERYETNFLLGEDYYFCKLAREAGVKLYIDNNLLVPHDTNLRLPVNNQEILSELGQVWRLHNDAQPEQVKSLIDQLRPLLSTDIP